MLVDLSKSIAAKNEGRLVCKNTCQEQIQDFSYQGVSTPHIFQFSKKESLVLGKRVPGVPLGSANGYGADWITGN